MPNLPQWIIDLSITLLGTFIGAFLAFRSSAKLANQQDKSSKEDKKQVYLNGFLEELGYNEKILREISKYIMKGPNIDHLWSPAIVNARFIENKAWNNLVNTGVLLNLNDNDAVKNLRITNRSILNSKRKIIEIEANWLRIKEWSEHDEKVTNQKLTTRELYLDTAISEGRGRIEYALERIGESRTILEKLIK